MVARLYKNYAIRKLCEELHIPSRRLARISRRHTSYPFRVFGLVEPSPPYVSNFAFRRPLNFIGGVRLPWFPSPRLPSVMITSSAQARKRM